MHSSLSSNVPAAVDGPPSPDLQADTTIKAILDVAMSPMLVLDVAMVMGVRTLGLAGVVRLPQGEEIRMVAEKPIAVCEGMHELSRAIWAGRDPMALAMACFTPMFLTVRDNRARLYEELGETRGVQRITGETQ